MSDGPETAEGDTDDAVQDAAVNSRVASESSARSQPRATVVGCLPPTPFAIHTTPAPSEHSKVSQYLHM